MLLSGTLCILVQSQCVCVCVVSPFDSNAVDLVYLFAFVWSFGCNLNDASRAKFSEYVSVLLSPLIPESARGQDLYGLYVDTRSGALRPWADMTRSFTYNPQVCVTTVRVVVPSIATVYQRNRCCAFPGGVLQHPGANGGHYTILLPHENPCGQRPECVVCGRHRRGQVRHRRRRAEHNDDRCGSFG